MHCYFVLAGDSTIPVLYHVERVREGKSFMTRTVQARQRGKCIFTTTCSFVREGSGGEKVVEHEWRLPEGAVEMLEARLKDTTPLEGAGPFAMVRLGVINRGFQTFDIGEGQNNRFSNTIFAPSESSPDPHMKKARQWTRAYGNISASGGQQAHLSALAYMSDNWFIGTVPRVHGLLRTSPNPASPPPTSSSSLSTVKSPSPIRLKEVNPSKIGTVAAADSALTIPPKTKPTVGMMVSLDHSIYFHRPREVVADDWLLAENQSPWTGEGRGLVMQRIWGRGGSLLATCVQEVFPKSISILTFPFFSLGFTFWGRVVSGTE